MRRRGRRERARAGLSEPPRVKLTSMMDILTVLLLFLLKSFVVDADVVTPPPDVDLPNSTSRAATESSLVIAISEEMISVGGEPVLSIDDAMAGDVYLSALGDRLEGVRDQMDEIAERSGRQRDVHMVTIQGDKNVEYQLLQRVMITCNSAGFDQLSLAVVQSS